MQVYRGVIPQTEVVAVASLIAGVFLSAEAEGCGPSSSLDNEFDNDVNIAQIATYQLKLAAALQFRGFTEGRQFVTVVAFDRSSSSMTTEKQLVGAVTITPGLAAANVEEGFKVPNLSEDDECVLASIANMAVAPTHRRQGIGRRLLTTAEEATGSWPVPPSAFALTVYRSNDAAQELYSRAGFTIEESWMDPRWLKSAESGKIGVGRRVLMVKRVLGWTTDEEDGAVV